MGVVTLGVHIVDVLGAPVDGSFPPRDRYVIDEVAIAPGGTAGGTALDLAKLGVEVLTIGPIGSDEFGDIVSERLASYGVDVSGLARKAAGNSATILALREDGERFIIFHRPGASRHLERGDVDLDAIAAADLLHVGGPDALGDFATDPLPAVLRHARAHGVPITMDVLSPCDEATLARIAPAIELVDFFFPNEIQVRGMTGIEDPVEGARALIAIGAPCVVVTRGPEGSTIVTERERIDVPILAGPVVDTTGCGDAYTAGFILGTLKGSDLRSRGLLGAACAASVAGGLGSDAGIPDLGAVLDALEEQFPAAAGDLLRRATEMGERS